MMFHSMTLAVRAWLAARPSRRFVLLALGLYAGWVLGYEGILLPDGRLDHLLSTNLAAAAAGLLRTGGLAAGTLAGTPRIVTMFGEPAVIVGDPCNGLVLYALFAGFVVAYPSSSWRKRWFLPLGLTAIYLLNVVRVAVLALNHTYWYHTVDFNHHYTFTFLAYGAILALWRLWVGQAPVVDEAL